MQGNSATPGNGMSKAIIHLRLRPEDLKAVAVLCGCGFESDGRMVFPASGLPGEGGHGLGGG